MGGNKDQPQAAAKGSEKEMEDHSTTRRPNSTHR